MKGSDRPSGDDGAVTVLRQRPGMYPYRRLAVWEKSHELTLRVFQATDGPAARRFPFLASQLRRSVASIPANLAEGSGHTSQAQFKRYIEISVGSARETDYHLLLAKDLQLIDSKTYAVLEARLAQVLNMLGGLRKRVQERVRATETSSGGRRGSEATAK